MKIDTTIASQILQESCISEIKDYLKTINFKTMLDDGKQKVKENKTSLEELYRVI